MSRRFDIVIVGGGMVGATLAIALRKSGYCIALVEANIFEQQEQAAYDDRSIALSYGSSRLLRRFGLWSAIEQVAEPIRHIHVSDKGHFGVTHMHADEECVPALGYIVESRAYGAAIMPILRGLEKENRFHMFCPARLTQIETTSSFAKITIDTDVEDSIELDARLVVAADGASSSVRRLLEIPAQQQIYEQSAIIANVSTQLPHRSVAYERFTSTGPIAVLPMSAYEGMQNRCAIVWTVPSANAESLLALPDGAFLDALQFQFGYRLGRFQYVGKRSNYPLSLVTSEKTIATRTAFVGNAAQTLHPVAGQGFNLALRDVASLVDCLNSEDRHRKWVRDAGEESVLESYITKRRGDRQRVIQFTDKLVKLFSNDMIPVAHMRSLGLFALDVLPVVRRFVARRAMGAGMPLPHVNLS